MEMQIDKILVDLKLRNTVYYQLSKNVIRFWQILLPLIICYYEFINSLLRLGGLSDQNIAQFVIDVWQGWTTIALGLIIVLVSNVFDFSKVSDLVRGFLVF